MLPGNSHVVYRLYLIFYHRSQNSRFCLTLILQILEKLRSGEISAETARSWYQTSRSHGMFEDGLHAIMGAKVPRSPGDSMAHVPGDPTRKTEDIAPMEADEICRAFSEMVNRGWHEEAVEFLENIILKQVEPDDYACPDYLFHKLWFPFLVCAIDVYRDGDSPQWQTIDPILKDTLMSVLVTYLGGIVRPEPKKSELRREGLPEGCDCNSCRAIDSFLFDQRRTRQIFQIVKHEAGQRPPQFHGVCISHSALSHFTPYLDDSDRECTFHVRDSSAAGPVLVVQKRLKEREWEEWVERRAEGRKELAPILKTKFFRNIMGGEANYEEWEELRFLERGYGGEVRSPFLTNHPRPKLNRILFALRRQAMENLLLSKLNLTYDADGPALAWVDYHRGEEITVTKWW